MGQTVLDSYVQEHIPHAIDLALKINTPEHKKFIWTVGSFLADYYKRHATPEQLEKMDEAIRLGYFRWHGLAVTSHTELQSPEVLAYNLSVSRKLDREYGVHTIAAKMTDVPGHTIALVRPLSEAGIRYLHIGVNPSSRVPRVPEVFRWRRDGHEVIVHYSAQYGQAISIPGFDEALEFAHTNDNRGPQDAAQVEAELARIQAKYPGAVVEASTLDAFAASLEKSAAAGRREKSPTRGSTASDRTRTRSAAIRRCARWRTNGSRRAGSRRTRRATQTSCAT
ncbi:MAG: hypothetical protein ACLUJ0_15360 [Ruthenibacterium lactatiformans]